MSSNSHYLTVTVSPFSNVQSNAKAHAVKMEFIDVHISDSCDLEDSEYRPTLAPKVSAHLDNPYTMVPKTQSIFQHTSSGTVASSSTFVTILSPHEHQWRSFSHLLWYHWEEEGQVHAYSSEGWTEGVPSSLHVQF